MTQKHHKFSLGLPLNCVQSTFIKALTGEQSIDSGVVEPGDTVVFSTYDQMGIPFLDENQVVLDFMKQRVENSSGGSMSEAPQEAMKMLKQFQFPRQRWNERLVLPDIPIAHSSYDMICQLIRHNIYYLVRFQSLDALRWRETKAPVDVSPHKTTQLSDFGRAHKRRGS